MCYTEHSFINSTYEDEVLELFNKYNINIDEYIKLSKEVFNNAHKYTTS